jgi:hypothetical protein
VKGFHRRNVEISTGAWKGLKKGSFFKEGAMTTEFIVLLFISFIYVLVMVGFNKARSKFQGGRIGKLINLIMVTVIFLFVADYVLLLEEVLSRQIIFLVQTLSRTTGLSILAFGGIRMAGS